MGDIINKNVVLLFQWWWQYLTRDNPLWKRTMCSNHGSLPSQIISAEQNADQTNIWGQITNLRVFGMKSWKLQGEECGRK